MDNYNLDAMQLHRIQLTNEVYHAVYIMLLLIYKHYTFISKVYTAFLHVVITKKSIYYSDILRTSLLCKYPLLHQPLNVKRGIYI